MGLGLQTELIAPAGNMECARAAVANGANAVYFGLPSFNARMRADNFTPEELPQLVDFLHQHNVRALAAFNTLIFTNELSSAKEQLRRLEDAGTDAVIIQDLGLAVLAQSMNLRMAVHASTQMTITSPEGLRMAQQLGIRRVVLARELSIREIAKFREPGMPELEVFVHGALCVAYSGQCLTSEVLGQRSANRGECAQACRLPYQLLVDAIPKPLENRHYLLSPHDLAAVNEIPELIRLGVRGFKIEGRLKSPEYVAATTQVYRKAIDSACAQIKSPIDQNDWYQLEMTFSRGFYSGWLNGVNHQRLVTAKYGKKRGPFAGMIQKVGRDFVEFESQVKLSPGDGIVFDTGGDPNQEQGGFIYEVSNHRYFFKHGHIQFHRLKPGDGVWKTSDPQLQKVLRQSFTGNIEKPKIELQVAVYGKVGSPLKLQTHLEQKFFQVESDHPLVPAEKRPLTAEFLTEQLGRLGDTPFILKRIDFQLEGSVILPVSHINSLRRKFIGQISAWKAACHAPSSPSSKAGSSPFMIEKFFAPENTLSTSPISPHLSVLCRTLDQVDASLNEGISCIYVDFEDIRRYREAVEKVRSHSQKAEIILATPRIQKAGEQGFFKLIESHSPHGVLIRNLGGLDYFRHLPIKKIGDFSLNIANPITAQWLKKEDLDYLTISYDLNAHQVFDLLQKAPPSWFELTLHQHMPMFHMEHCLFAAFLSKGTDHTNCGRPCDHHQLHLRDRLHTDHPVKPDVGCRNTVFHHRAQSGADFLKTFLNTGLFRYRIEMLEESPEETRQTIRSYSHLLQSQGAEIELFRHALPKVHHQLGVVI